MRYSKSTSKKEVNSDKSLSKETRKSQVNNLTLHLKQPAKEEEIKTKVVEEIIKVRAQTN